MNPQNNDAFIKDIILTETQRKALKRLNQSEDWDALCEVVENLLQTQVYDLLASNCPKKEKHERMYEYEGGFFLWTRIKKLLQYGIEDTRSENPGVEGVPVGDVQGEI